MQSYQKDVAKTLFGTRRMSNSCTRRMFKCAMLKWFLYFTKPLYTSICMISRKVATY